MFGFTIRQIEVFLTVCETGSFRRAADRLDLSEASISHHIRILEEQMGYDLFQRHRGVASSLTPSGQIFRSDALTFVELGRELGRRALKAEEDVTLRLFVGQHMLEECIRPALPQFLRQHPRINLSFAPMAPHPTIRQALKVGELDGVLVAVPSERQLPNSIMLSRAECGIYGNSEMLSRAKSGDLATLPFLLCDTTLVDKQDQIRLLRSGGVTNPIFAGVFQFPDAAIAMALQGRGVVAMLDPVVHSYDPLGELRLIKRLASWERRLFLRPELNPATAKILTEFFTSALAKHDLPAPSRTSTTMEASRQPVS